MSHSYCWRLPSRNLFDVMPVSELIIRVINCTDDISRLNSATGTWCFIAMFLAIDTINAVLPIPGRAAITIRSLACQPGSHFVHIPEPGRKTAYASFLFGKFFYTLYGLLDQVVRFFVGFFNIRVRDVENPGFRFVEQVEHIRGIVVRFVYQVARKGYQLSLEKLLLYYAGVKFYVGRRTYFLCKLYKVKISAGSVELSAASSNRCSP